MGEKKKKKRQQTITTSRRKKATMAAKMKRRQQIEEETMTTKLNTFFGGTWRINVILFGGIVFLVLSEMIMSQSILPSFIGLDSTTSPVAAVIHNVSDAKKGSRRKSNVTYVYYQHVRKCAGGVGRSLLKNTTSPKLIENEFFSFPASCVNTPPESNQTLFLTMLRDPAERYASEFRYQGLHNQNNYDLIKATSEEVRAAVRHWIGQSSACMKPSWKPRCFYPNMYVRIFSGKQRCRVYEAPANASGKRKLRNWAGSQVDVGPVTEQDYLLALDVLKRFDLVLTTKKLGPSATEKAIDAGFNVSKNSVWNQTVHDTKRRFDILSYEGVREMLEEHLQYDMKIFQYFESLP